jgi:hypothetical protein
MRKSHATLAIFFFFLSKVSDTIVLMYHNFKVEFKANGCEALEVAK